MHLTEHGDPSTAAAAVYDRLMHARAHTYRPTHTYRHTELYKGLKMEPEPQTPFCQTPLIMM